MTTETKDIEKYEPKDKTDPTKSGCINCGHDDFREVPAE